MLYEQAVNHLATSSKYRLIAEVNDSELALRLVHQKCCPDLSAAFGTEYQALY